MRAPWSAREWPPPASPRRCPRRRRFSSFFFVDWHSTDRVAVVSFFSIAAPSLPPTAISATRQLGRPKDDNDPLSMASLICLIDFYGPTVPPCCRLGLALNGRRGHRRFEAGQSKKKKGYDRKRILRFCCCCCCCCCLSLKGMARWRTPRRGTCRCVAGVGLIDGAGTRRGRR